MEKKTYKITFMADLTEEDVRAMKKCFYDAMQEAMQIEPCWELKLEEIKFEGEPDPGATDLPEWPEIKQYVPSLEELLLLPVKHIQNIKDCFEACKSKQDVNTVLERIRSISTPAMFGDFVVEFDDELQMFYITNTYIDDDEGEIEEEYCYDYPADWDWDAE